MAIERARAQAVPKPWGVADLRPWCRADHDGVRLIGEILYERSSSGPPEPSLLLKLLFTSQPLSIQVHPDDAYAQSIGLACGKTEAWYILSAAPGARIVLGLKKQLAPRQLREAVNNGSIAALVAWRTVLPGDVVPVPAGTIHAIGAGLVIVEVQQRSDATFRMFDFGRKRDLHIADAVVVAYAGPADGSVKPKRLTDERTLLVSNPHFVFERIELAPGSVIRLDADRETWLLVVSGSARAGRFDIATGDAVFAQSDIVDIRVGAQGMASLVAYTGVGGPVPRLLQSAAQPSVAHAESLQRRQMPTSLLHTKADRAHGLAGATP
jgi:mannose-6-phosphate isomerase